MPDAGYKTWIDEVDLFLQDRIGLRVDDLADAPWRDYFNDGLDPKEALGLALEDWNDASPELLEELGI